VTAFRAGSATDVGFVRTMNQDSSYVSDDLVAVADGMGGHVGGEIAAQVAIDALRQAFSSDRTAAGLVAATLRANRAILDRSERETRLHGMGTTLTAAAIVQKGREQRIAVTNVGDSRAYVLSDGRFVQLTEDHSLVEEMVRSGELTAAEAAVHPHRHILTRALGIDPTVKVDSWQVDPVPGTRLLLCSDGLTNECSDEEIAAVLAAVEDASAAARRLVGLALEHGGSDNVTVVVVDLDLESEPDHGVPPVSSQAEDDGATSGARPAGGPAGTRPPLRPAAAGPPSRAPRPPRPSQRATPARPPRPHERVVTLRSVLFVLLLVGTLGGIAGTVEWWVRATYFVGIDSGHVAVFEGRPGGFLWFKPRLVDRTALRLSQVFRANLGPLRAGMLEPSLAAAESVVSSLTHERRQLGLPRVDTSGALGVVGVAGTTATTQPVSTTTTTGTTGTTGTLAGAATPAGGTSPSGATTAVGTPPATTSVLPPTHPQVAPVGR
jgi:protein phosphatase